MGSSSSKLNAASSSSSSSTRSKRSRVFQSSCLGQSSRSHDHENDKQASDHQTKENDSKNQCEKQNESDLDQMKAESYGKAKVEPPNDGICISTQSSNPRTRFLSRFRFFPGNISFRLNRATSLGSSSAYPVSSTNFAIPNEEEELHFPTRQHNEDFASSNSRSSRTFGFHDGFQDDHITSTQDLAIDIDNNRVTRVNSIVNTSSPSNQTEMEGIERRFTDGWNGSREPVERNVRFSRTLSVGRLRDRVIRRSSFHDLTICPLQHERQVRDTNQDSGGSGAFLESHGNPLFSQASSGYAPSSMHNSLYSSQDYALETSRAREVRYRGLLENRSNFLERRRRIRSQVRALQRLGGRFENLSGHERSCILSGQHRTGRCSCRNGTRDANTNHDSNARASISRIVMLAEALFEVLDEIQQQSVVLSSQPSISPIGSVPAPNERVECLPLKIYSKSQKHLNEEIAQCYICLVEYEEGDSMRILPCHHEFHRICIDKWLKEIHRVCPLCRGDICRSASLPADN